MQTIASASQTTIPSHSSMVRDVLQFMCARACFYKINSNTDVLLLYDDSIVDRPQRREEEHTVKPFVNQRSDTRGLESGEVCQALELDGEVEVSKSQNRSIKYMHNIRPFSF